VTDPKILPNAKASDPYYLDPTFERAVVMMCCSRPAFWGRIGYALDPDCLQLEPAKRALRACRQIAGETHRGPESPMIVLQHMRRWADEGKPDGTLAKIREVALLFDDASEVGLVSDDAATATLKPILARRMKDEAVLQAIEERGKDGNFSNVVKLIDKANRLGDTNTDVGIRLGSASIAEIERRRTLDRLSTGIWELDAIIDGGMRRGCLGLFVGGPGDGKSMALSHAAAHAIRGNGGPELFTVYATLELPPADVLARIKANLTGIATNSILAEPSRVAPLLAAMPLAPLIVQEFTPQATTMADIEAWVEKCEAEVGRRVDVVVTDYGDKLAVPKTTSKDERESGYQQGRVVFERMRLFAHETGRWHWSASQATRPEKGKAKGVHRSLDLGDVADSMHKVRVADLVVTINTLENGIKWFVAKNRFGTGKVGTNPTPADFECGRVSPIMIPSDESLDP
jgi:hypothetical protein